MNMQITVHNMHVLISYNIRNMMSNCIIIRYDNDKTSISWQNDIIHKIFITSKNEFIKFKPISSQSK